MTDAEIANLAENWIAWRLAPEGSPQNKALSFAFGDAWDLCVDQPEDAWRLILEILRRDHSRAVLETLSAGPLEDLLAKHSELVIDRVEAEARANPHFATLLGGVWQNEMPDHIWHRVQGVWNRKGWDGIPEE